MQEPHLTAAALLLLIGGTMPAAAETCFRQCLAPRLTDSAIPDDRIRFEMRRCRDLCEGEALARVADPVRRRVESCRPEPLSLDEFRAVRGASPSYVVQSNAFTWDVRNPLPGKVIREIEIVAQTMDLRDTVMTAAGTVMPGESETLLVAGFFDGYPNARYATKVRTIWACSLD
ncbi:hypothetical protein [Prosthecomicrobium sp. N25]|uniref:hypothetical protein n=1 Tax=Prosthecomicrobium sp. N25 TaxID=3129254 RepID=UPI0030770B36